MPRVSRFKAHLKSLISLRKANFRIGRKKPIRNLLSDLDSQIFKAIFFEITNLQNLLGQIFCKFLNDFRLKNLENLKNIAF